MEVFCLSFSFQQVSLEWRSKLCFDENSLATACSRFRCGDSRPTPLKELIIVSTCNRIELYAVASWAAKADDVREELLKFTAESRGLPMDEIASLANFYKGNEVPDYLGRVACGIESQVIGEAQILGQIGDALRMALVMNSAGAVLSKLFLSAIRAGRLARETTNISRNSASIASVAVDKISETLGSLAKKCVVVLGAGVMAELALEHLTRKGAQQIIVVNRTLAAAKAVADKFNAQSAVLDRLDHLLPVADILITSTGAPHTIITREMIATAMQPRAERPLVVLDIAVPRDCAPDIREVPNVALWDLDQLHSAGQEAIEWRAREIPKVEEIIATEMSRFAQWRQGIDAERLISRWRQQLNEIRHGELQRLFGLLPELPEEVRETITRFSESLMNKLVHRPTVNLRQWDGSRLGVDFAEAIRQLYELDAEVAAEVMQEIGK